MIPQQPIALTVNAEPVHAFVEPRLSLADFLRTRLGLTGTRLGCEMGACGACLVRLDGRVVHACLMLAVQANGARIETIEYLSETGALSGLQAAFHARNALQCGYCTAGMLLTAQEYLDLGGTPDRAAIRDALSGNYCRCTGYEAIVDAIASVVADRLAKQ
jgi:carbon-monoxide dehydrogenase small subunit